MAGANLQLDAQQFLRGLNLAEARAQRGAKRGMALMLAHLERLSKAKCPVRMGTLAATISGDAKTIEVKTGSIEGRITAGGGEAADYAVVQHERELTHSFPQPGTYAAKFIEGPLVESAHLAGKVIAEEVKREL